MAEKITRFTVMGEIRNDASIAPYVRRQIVTGEYSGSRPEVLFLEVLKRGDYAKEGERLKHAYSPLEKYDGIIKVARDHGVEVRGITGDVFVSNESRALEVAEHIVTVSEGRPSLILADKARVEYWRAGTPAALRSIPHALGEYTPEGSIFTIVTHRVDLGELVRLGLMPKIYSHEELRAALAYWHMKYEAAIDTSTQLMREIGEMVARNIGDSIFLSVRPRQ